METPKPLALLFLAVVALAATSAVDAWSRGTATFYGGSDASGTMGGACGYDNLYNAGYGVLNAALSQVLFNNGASCGQCYTIKCDATQSVWCKPGNTVTVTATNLCPPNYALPNGGWCGPRRPHFDMSQPAWENIGIYRGGVIPVLYQRVRCSRQGGVRFRITGSQYFQLTLITNVGGSGSIQSMSVKGTKTGWIAMTRNWGAQWQSNSVLNKALSFMVTSTGGQTLYINNVVPDWWVLGMTFATNAQFDY
ncbi:unnamed protein product [Miscanthus lutarioriparius]|uniref:Expansin n=1 Tax=Miscanthus lutarioriparius TaxID=422564 RepID=A0A811MS49_9POAL|nr:unnamed protein product [Miscanthus lutarioriparius]